MFLLLLVGVLFDASPLEFVLAVTYIGSRRASSSSFWCWLVSVDRRPECRGRRRRRRSSTNTIGRVVGLIPITQPHTSGGTNAVRYSRRKMIALVWSRTLFVRLPARASQILT